MKSTSILVATALASAFGLVALAANEGDAAAKKQAEADYKAAMAQCRVMKGAEKQTCEKEAKDKRSEALANARSGKASTGSSGMGSAPASGSTFSAPPAAAPHEPIGTPGGTASPATGAPGKY